MLLEFRIKNYKSFREEAVFSMQPAPKQKDLAYSVLQQTAGSKAYKALCSSVIYGPNASGKSNCIGALEVLRSLILSGNIKNKQLGTTNMAVNKLELIPNTTVPTAAPVSFSVKVVYQGLLFEFSLACMLNSIINFTLARAIVLEQLKINNIDIYTRTQKGLNINFTAAAKAFFAETGFNKETSEELSKNLNPVDLFFTGAFKALCLNSIYAKIYDWFEKDLLVFFHGESLYSEAVINNDEQEKLAPHFLQDALHEFGCRSNQLYFVKSKDKEHTDLRSLIPAPNAIVGKNGETVLASVAADVYESLGTIRLSNLFPLVATALVNGRTLIIDEMDASLHPMALMSIINAFHNDEINKFGAQLIFNTHNPIFLNKQLFRRDEIKFVDRDDETGFSTLYALSDFGTSGSEGRKTSNYMKNYFISRYGAIKDVDFSGVLKRLVDLKVEQQYQEQEGEKIENAKKVSE